ncbi:hypothetical protein GCM10022212_08050 [Actimicrobium antarcticum]|uniref:Transposase n=2 Tax=Actimicrobium antarcticum TaxID=1051899 RepID=A0ABP7SRR7_9BURK
MRERHSEHPSIWTAIETITPIIRCVVQMLWKWTKRDGVDRCIRDGLSTDERAVSGKPLRGMSMTAHLIVMIKEGQIYVGAK